MRQLRFAALAAVAMFAAAPAFAADSPVVGTWATEAKSDFGTFKSTWTVAQNGGTYTIDVKDAPMDGAPGGGDGAPPKSTISNVKVDGSTLSFDRELVMGDMTIKINYKATANGNALTGQSHVNMGDMPMDIPITGTRQ
ncbi:MAG: hypothetical protein J2O44_02345 [Porphyrobacter sp.]|nr:hypothetical protein [Porphyrobacter sp.]